MSGPWPLGIWPFWFGPNIDVDVGVHHGSVLGGCLYVLLVGELPQGIHEDHNEAKYNQTSESRYNTHCKNCGGLAAFVR